jgi:uncharacterized protein
VFIDAFAFCRNGEQQAGKLRLTDLGRLHAECVTDEGDIVWTLAGEMSKQGYPALHLTVNGTVQLRCQRCLTSYAFQIQSDSTMLLAKDEQAADQLDALLEEDQLESGVEIIVGSKTFDVVALIEDEALLALPLSPRHEVCPGNLEPDNSVNVKKASPFAVLKDAVRKDSKPD